MAGLPLLPTTLIGAVVSLLLTSEAGLIHTRQRRRDLAAAILPGAGDIPATKT
jgi:hypothetical protein